MGTDLGLLTLYHHEGEALFDRILIDDECWIHAHMPKTKEQLKEWLPVGSWKPKN